MVRITKLSPIPYKQALFGVKTFLFNELFGLIFLSMIVEMVPVKGGIGGI